MNVNERIIQNFDDLVVGEAVSLHRQYKRARVYTHARVRERTHTRTFV